MGLTKQTLITRSVSDNADRKHVGAFERVTLGDNKVGATRTPRVACGVGVAGLGRP